MKDRLSCLLVELAQIEAEIQEMKAHRSHINHFDKKQAERLLYRITERIELSRRLRKAMGEEARV